MTTFRLSHRRDSEPLTPLARKAVVAGSVGSFIEYYDYLLFAVLTIYLSPLFFPAANPSVSILAGLSVYAAGYAAKPIGAVVFGRIGDRRGRRTALLATVLLMGICSSLIAVLPTYAAIGIAAPTLLVVLRFMQGMATGAELLGATTYVLESVPRRRRAFHSTIVQTGSALGGSVGALTAAVISLTVSPQAMLAFGWRIPFLIALPLTVVSFALRRGLEDSPEFQRIVAREQVTTSPLREALVTHRRPMALAALLSIAHAGFGGLYGWVVPYLSGIRGLPAGEISLVFGIALTLSVIGAPFAGLLTDRFGPRRMIRIGFVVAAILMLPILGILGSTTSSLVLTITITAYLIMVYILATPVYLSLVELFPAPVRFTGSTVAFNIGAVAAGGTAPLVVSLLVLGTGSVYGAAIWIGASALIGVVAALAGRRRLGGPSAAPVSAAPEGEQATTTEAA